MLIDNMEKQFLRKIEIVHIGELEEEAIVVIQDWERNKSL